MSKYINYFWYFIAGSLLILVAAVALMIFAPRPWYQFRAPVYREAMLNVAKQIGFSPDDAILEGSGWYDCSIVYPSCTCYQFVVFQTNQSFTGFQQQFDKSNLSSISSWENYHGVYLFDYLPQFREPVLKVNREVATWDYFESRDEGFNAFYWSYEDQQQRWHSISFFGIGEVHEPLELFEKPFSDNFVVVKTEMGNYPPKACDLGIQITKKQ